MWVASKLPGGAHRLAVAPLLAGCTVGLSISWNIANIGPVASLLARHYGASLSAVGLLTTILFLAELAVMLPGGGAIDRYGPKRVGLIAVALSLVANLLLMIPASAQVALALRSLAGLGVGLGFLAGAIYAQAGAGHSAPLAGGIYGGVALSGGGLALAVVPQLVPALSWRAPYASGAAVAALAAVLVGFCPGVSGRGGPRSGPRPSTLLRDPAIVRLGLVAAASFGFSVILGNWVVTLLERTGSVARGSAGAIGSLILLLGIVGRPAGGALVRARPHRTRRLLAAAFLSGGLGTAVLVLSLAPEVDAAASAVVGLAAGIPFGVTVAGATRAYPRAAGAAVGAMNVYPVLVIVCGVPLVGAGFGLPGHGRIGFAVLAALWVGALALLPRLDT